MLGIYPCRGHYPRLQQDDSSPVFPGYPECDAIESKQHDSLKHRTIVIIGGDMNKRTLQIVAKIGLLLVVIGFFLPISCDQNGFGISDSLSSSGTFFSADKTASFLLYIMFASALLGALLLPMNKHFIILDWSLFAVSIGSGLITVSLISKYSEFSSPQIGAYLIGLGYLVSAISLTLATFKFKNPASDHDTDS